MPRHFPVLVKAVTIAAIAGAPSLAAAQSAAVPPPVSTQAAFRQGRVLGIVRDDAGRAIGGVSIIALGTASAMARTDARGRFDLPLLPGDYVLRASHDSYISTYREAVRVQSSARLEREITLVRPGLVAGQLMLTSAMAKAGETSPAGDAERDHSHSEAAWRLRHLPRTVLRDGVAIGDAVAESPAQAFTMPRESLFDRAVFGSARLASAFFTDTNFDGQINLLTTGAGSGPSRWLPDEWPRGVAYIAVGADAGALGDWRMRAAVSGGDGRAPAWVMLGEFLGREDAAHAFRVGVSYGTQGDDPSAPGPWSGAASGSRGVAGVYGFDRWRIGSSVVLDYGARVDRYDYLSQPELVSPRIAGRVIVLPGTSVTALASRRLIAPGADEFLPPPASGPWVPPERTFSSLIGRTPLRAEDVRHFEVGVEHEFGGGAPVVSTVLVRRFRQSATDQAVTIFGLDATRDVGHYYVATPGDVELDGWGIGVRRDWRNRVRAGIDYVAVVARWDEHRQARAVRRVAPSAVRADRERLHDVSASIDADIPETRTRIAVVVRTNSAFSRADGGGLPVFDGRFDVEIHQALPYQPIQGGALELLFSVRTLCRDGHDPASIYDEVLTVAPPLRLVGGFQIRF